MKNLVLLFTVNIFFIGIVNAQMPSQKSGQTVISGKIRDAASQRMMEYANVVLLNSSDSSMIDGCLSSADGLFELKNVPMGMYLLRISFIGYSEKYIQITNTEKGQNIIDLGTIDLAGMYENIAGTEIVAEKQVVEYKIDKKVVNVSKDIVAASGSATDVLRNVPSVRIDAEGNAAIRGSYNFTVLINGRPVNREANDVLKQTPASSIEKIEIITNPSAKYDPEGTAGIINIILKKNLNDGLNGIVNTSCGNFNKYSTDIQLNIRKGKMNFFGSAEYNNRIDKVFQNIEKTWYRNDSTDYTLSEVDQQYKRWHYKINLGADVYINSKNSLTVSGNYFRQDFLVNSPVAYHIFSDPMINDDWLHYTNDLLLKHQYKEGNLVYSHNFKKPEQTLMFNLSYNVWNGDKNDEQVKSVTAMNWGSILYNDSQRRRMYENESSRISGDMDYTLPLSKSLKLETGYSVDITQFNSNYYVDNFDYDFNDWLNDSSMTNGFEFNYAIHAVYATLGGELPWVSYQLGLRGEYFIRDLVTQFPDKNYPMEIWSLFPSLHLSKNLKNNRQIMFSYSRRVNRPTVMALNPLPYFNDDYLVHYGNPALRPEYADSYELSFQKYFGESFVSAELYYRSTTDKMAQTIEISQGKSILTNKNIAMDWASGMEISGNLKVGKSLRLNTSLNGFYYMLIGNEESGVADRSAYTANISFNPSYVFKRGTILQLQSVYSAPGVDAIGNVEDYFMLNAAVRQNFLKGKLGITLSANNLFNLTGYHYTDRTSMYLHNFDYLTEGNVISLSVSYKINNYSRRVSRQSNGAMDVGV